MAIYKGKTIKIKANTLCPWLLWSFRVLCKAIGLLYNKEHNFGLTIVTL